MRIILYLGKGGVGKTTVAAATIGRWNSVRRGEKNYIFPYQNSADVFFNSALVYELSALKPLAEPLLLQVESGTPERLEANRLMACLLYTSRCV